MCINLDKHASFKNYCASYNGLLHSDISKDIRSRAYLIDKRLCESWFYYNYLIIKKANKEVANLFDYDPQMQNLDEALGKMRSVLFPCFVKKWSEHTCGNPNCSMAINIDENHKLSRLTCIYDNIYFDSLEIMSNIQQSSWNKFFKFNYFKVVDQLFVQIHQNETVIFVRSIFQVTLNSLSM